MNFGKVFFIFSFFSITILFSQQNNQNTFYNGYFRASEVTLANIEIGVASSSFSNNSVFLNGEMSLLPKLSMATEFLIADNLNSNNLRLILFAGYNLLNQTHKLTIGPAFEISNQSLGINLAYGYDVNSELLLTLKGGIFFEEIDANNQFVNLETALIYLYSDKIKWIGEFYYAQKGISKIYSKEDSIVGSVGIDYRILKLIGLRGNIGYNFGDSTDNLIFQVGLSYTL
jgi:hypothetical protein